MSDDFKVQHFTGNLGDEVILPFQADPLQGVAGFTFEATFTVYDNKPGIRLVPVVDPSALTVSVTLTVRSGRLVIRRFSGGQHQTTVAILDITGRDPASPHTR